jgi:hypothetical protein
MRFSAEAFYATEKFFSTLEADTLVQLKHCLGLLATHG